MHFPKHQQPECRKHHFLYHIFRIDKAENPMPRRWAENLLEQITGFLTEKN